MLRLRLCLIGKIYLIFTPTGALSLHLHALRLSIGLLQLILNLFLYNNFEYLLINGLETKALLEEMEITGRHSH